ncbi:hypothetical protein HMI55_001661, partial [Coelomomyces lativittatus]
MAKDGKCTVMVSILEGRFFPKRPSFRVFIQCTFNKVMLAVDPVSHTASPIWDTELAWDLEARALHFLRSQRSTIKLMCYSLSPQEKKELLGYIVLDLRSTESFPAREKWMPLINNKLSSKARPEIKLAFGAGPQLLEPDLQLPKSNAVSPFISPSHQGNILQPLAHVDPSPSKEALPISPVNSSKSLRTPLIHPVSFSSPTRFDTPDPHAATDEVSPVKDPHQLQIIQDGTYSLGQNFTNVYHLSIKIVSLKDLHFLSIIPTPTHSSSGFYIFLQVFNHQLKTIPFPDYKAPSFPEENLKFKIKSNINDITTFFMSLKCFKIYLCFEEKILAESTFEFPSLPDFLGTEFTCTLLLIEPGIQIRDHPKLEMKLLLRELSLSKSTSPISNIKPVHRTLNEKITVDSPSQPPSTIVWHQYRFSIDIKAIRDLVLHSSNVFVKYSYPAFGTPSPFISHPPVQVFKNIETPFHQAFAAYEFVMSPLRLQQYFERVPLEIQLFHKDEFTKDQYLGSSHVSFSSLLKQPKKQVSDTNQKVQVFDQWVYIFTDESKKTRVATLRIALSLEDFGIIEEQVGFEPGGLTPSTEQVPPSVPPPVSELSSQEIDHSPQISTEKKLEPETFESKVYDLSNSSFLTPSISAQAQTTPFLSHSHPSLETFFQQAQMQVDNWKKKQEVLFSQELKKRDQMAMEELEKKMLEKESILDAKMLDFRILEEQLEKLLGELEARETKLAEAEKSLEDRQIDLERVFQNKCTQVDDLATKLATEYQQKHQLESQLTQELQRQKSVLIQERDEWEAKYRQLDAQFFDFKNKHTVPETEYQKKIMELTEKL